MRSSRATRYDLVRDLLLRFFFTKQITVTSMGKENVASSKQTSCLSALQKMTCRQERKTATSNKRSTINIASENTLVKCTRKHCERKSLQPALGVLQVLPAAMATSAGIPISGAKKHRRKLSSIVKRKQNKFGSVSRNCTFTVTEVETKRAGLERHAAKIQGVVQRTIKNNCRNPICRKCPCAATPLFQCSVPYQVLPNGDVPPSNIHHFLSRFARRHFFGQLHPYLSPS